ncbi:hypothetical protein ABPG74_007982 [Tetrahymena malaccensis]
MLISEREYNKFIQNEHLKKERAIELINLIEENDRYFKLCLIDCQCYQLLIICQEKNTNKDYVLLVQDKQCIQDKFKINKCEFASSVFQLKDFKIYAFEKQIYFSIIDISQYSIEQIQLNKIKSPLHVESYFLQRKGYYLSIQDCLIIRNQIQKFVNIKSLTLNLSNNSYYFQLYPCYNYCRDKDNYWIDTQFQEITIQIERFPSLENLHLNFSRNNISDLSKLGFSLRKCKNLMDLNLNFSHNCISSESIDILVEQIACMKNLESFELNLDQNSEKIKECFEEINTSLHLKKFMVSLDLDKYVCILNSMQNSKKIFSLKCEQMPIKKTLKALIQNGQFLDYNSINISINKLYLAPVRPFGYEFSICQHYGIQDDSFLADLLQLFLQYRGKEKLEQFRLIVYPQDKQLIEVISMIRQFTNLNTLEISDYFNQIDDQIIALKPSKIKVFKWFSRNSMKNHVRQKILKMKYLVQFNFKQTFFPIQYYF